MHCDSSDDDHDDEEDEDDEKAENDILQTVQSSNKKFYSKAKPANKQMQRKSQAKPYQVKK